MVTKEQALTANEFHYQGGRKSCFVKVGPRGGKTAVQTICRRNGRTLTWKRDPTRFCVPIKYGLYQYGEITEDNAQDWHTEEDCPLNHKEHTP